MPIIVIDTPTKLAVYSEVKSLSENMWKETVACRGLRHCQVRIEGICKFLDARRIELQTFVKSPQNVKPSAQKRLMFSKNYKKGPVDREPRNHQLETFLAL